MRPLSTLASVSAFLFAFSVFPAHADIPPPEGQPENPCQIKNYDADRCEECAGGHYDPTACETKFEGEGYERACRSSGASVWTEVWCKPSPEGEGDSAAGEAPAPNDDNSAAGEAPAPNEDNSQGAQDGKQEASGSNCATGQLGFLALLGLPFLFRRRA